MPDRPTLTALKPLFTFPFRGPGWRNHFLIGMLLFFANFVIPVLPSILLLGYTLQITRQAIRGQELHLPAWEDWGRLALDGLRAFAVYLVYVLPGTLVILGGMGLYFASAFTMPLAAALFDQDSALILAMPLIFMLGMGIMFISMVLGMILSFLGAIPLPIATARFVDQDRIGAAFQLRELWAILKANTWSYLIAWTLSIGIFGILYFVLLTIYMSMVLCCLIPVVIAPIAFYLMVTSAALFGQAYRESQLAMQPSPAE